MNKKSIMSGVFAVALIGSMTAQAGVLNEDYTVSTSQLSEVPKVSNVDLAQRSYLSSSATGINEAPIEHAQLFNGLIGNDDGDADDLGEVKMDSGTTVNPTIEEVDLYGISD